MHVARGVVLSVALFSVVAFAQAFKVGDKVHAKWGSEWKTATVIAIRNGAPRPIKIHYDGYDGSFDNWFTAAELQPGPAPAAAPVAPVATAPAKSFVDPLPTRFKEGDLVEAKDGETWTRAKIIQVKPGSRPWYVHFEGQDSSRDVQRFDNEVRPAGELYVTIEKGSDDGSGPFKANAQVQVQDGQGWNLATVVMVKGGRSYVDRTGGNSEWVDAARLRALPDNAAANSMVKDGLVANVQSDVNYSGNIKVGDTVEAYIDVGWGQKWTKCTVQELKGDELKVHYGGSQYNVRWIKKSELRNLDKEAMNTKTSRFWSQVAPMEQSVGGFLLQFTKQFPADTSIPMESRTPEDIANRLNDLAKIDAVCKQTPADVLAVDANDTNWKHNSKLFCDLAAARAKLGAARAKTLMDGSVGGRLAFVKNKLGVPEQAVAGGKGIAHVTEPVDGDDVFFNGGQKTLAHAKASLAKFAGTMPPEEIAKLEGEFATAITEAQERFKKNLPAASFSTKTSDATIERVAKAFLAKNYPGAVPLKAGVETNEWRYEKTDKGLTLARLKWADILWKDPAKNLCAVGGFLYNEEALVGGGYESPGFITSSYGYYFTWSWVKCP